MAQRRDRADERSPLSGPPRDEIAASEDRAMLRAAELGESVRGTTAPNPWVGAVLVTADGRRFEGATEPPPGRHAEIVAFDAARDARSDPAGATLYTTLEPCSHTGRTPPCVEAIIAAGIARVVVGVADPDPNVAGQGVAALRAAGVDVAVGAGAASTGHAASGVRQSLAPYLHQRRTGRPWVVLKLAATLDGRTAAPDGTSQWITSPEARADAHALRARCDAVLVGAGTVRADNPSLTVRELPLGDARRALLDMREALRDMQPPAARRPPDVRRADDEAADAPLAPTAVERLDPRRFVLGTAPAGANVQPCTEITGALPAVLGRLATDGVVELLVEGGAQVAGELHRAGLVDEYVVYLAPALMGGDDGLPLLTGAGAASMDGLWRGQMADVTRVGTDLRITMFPAAFPAAPSCA